MTGAGRLRRHADHIFYAGATVAMLITSSCTAPLVGDGPVTSIGARLMPETFPRRPGMDTAELKLLNNREADWGLALSGGGLRSAMFSLGVLKALYDAGRLQHVDMVSTVSGGGYTAYWLYANQLAAPSSNFGSFSLSDDQYPKRMCDLITKSNFVTYGRLGRVIHRGLRARSAKLYERSLLRTFGTADRVWPPLRIADLRNAIAAKQVPYLIMNATIDNPSVEQSWPHKLIEFTPLFYGSRDFGYRSWAGTPYPQSPAIRHIASVSGAAFAPLKQRVELDDPATGRRGLVLWDGGKSENLGAFALIMRGVQNIIISDAEHDPAYTFGAYQKLRNNLELYGLHLQVAAIDGFLRGSRKGSFPTSVVTGEVTDNSGHPVSSIYYIKATLPDELRPVLRAQGNTSSVGAAAQREYMRALRQSADVEGEWNCDDVLIGSLPLREWAAHNAGSYADYINRRNLKVKVMNAAGNAIWRDLKIGFPQYSTADQSFYLDQALAFIGLGYLEGSQMRTVTALAQPVAGSAEP